MYEILFQYGPVTIATFNLFLATSFVVGIIYLVKIIQLKKLRLNFFVDHLAWFLIAPLVSGRIFYIGENLSLFQDRPLQTLKIWDLGFSGFGAFYGGLAILFWLTRKQKIDVWAWLDAFTISAMVGVSILNLGRFFSGSQYGIPTELPWGIAFDTLAIPYTTPIHPTQLYAALLAFLLVQFSRKRIKRTHLPGVVGTLMIMIYSLGALGIDFLHGDPSLYAKVSYALIAAGAFLLYIHASHKKILDS